MTFLNEALKNLSRGGPVGIGLCGAGGSPVSVSGPLPGSAVGQEGSRPDDAPAGLSRHSRRGEDDLSRALHGCRATSGLGAGPVLPLSVNGVPVSGAHPRSR